MVSENNIVNKAAIKEFIDAYETQRELARRSGLSRNTIYKVKNGQREPGMKFINGMLRAGMPADRLFIA